MQPIKQMHGFDYAPSIKNSSNLHAAVFHRGVFETACLAGVFFASTVFVSVVASAMPSSSAAKGQSRSSKSMQVSLSNKDSELLEGLLKSFVFDPKGAKRVRVEWVRRGAWGESEKVNREGWLVESQGNTQGRIYFADGLFIFAPKGKDKIEELDFLKECQKRFAPVKKKKILKKGDLLSSIDPDSWKLAADSMQRESAGEIGEPDLVIAAWLYRLGHNNLAARALQDARNTKDQLQKDMAWAAFSRMVHCFMVGEDVEALRAGERLLNEIPNGTTAFPSTKRIVFDLKRRKAKGTFGKVKGDPLPKGFQNWKVEKKIAFLVEALDDVSARQFMQPGGVALGHDPRIRAFSKIGDQAMPALLDTIENDDRLTRSVGFFRDFGRSRYVETVGSAARCVVVDILDVGETYTWPIARLRRFWKENARNSKTERLMNILTDPNSGFEEARQAAEKFTHLDPYDFDKPAETWWQIGQDQPKKLDPRIAKLENPTVAEAILVALFRDLARSAEDESYWDFDGKRAEDTFLNALADIGDRRIAPALERRYKQAKNVRLRHRLAYTASRLGNPRPMKDFAREVEDGTLKVPKSNEKNAYDSERLERIMLRGIIKELSNVDLPETNRALYALANPKHAYYPVVSKRVLDGFSWEPDPGEWCSHPFCLIILRRTFDDKTPTDEKYKIKDGRLSEKSKNGSMVRPIPDILADPSHRLSSAGGRACDRPAARLTYMLSGIPEYHRLLKDADTRLEEVKRQFDHRLKEGFRRFFDESTFIPNIPPLGRPATDKDVKEGKAVFHLNGKGKLAQLHLPAVAVLKESKQLKDAKPLYWYQKTTVFIYQAEVDEAGTIHYGICTYGGIKTVTGDRLTEIREVRHPAKMLIAYPPPKLK